MYDVQKGSLSDDPSDENIIKHTVDQLYNSLRNTRKILNNEFDHMESLLHRVMDLSQKVVNKNNETREGESSNWPTLRYDDPNFKIPEESYHEKNLRNLRGGQ